jgi:hypothetical protein
MQSTGVCNNLPLAVAVTAIIVVNIVVFGLGSGMSNVFPMFSSEVSLPRPSTPSAVANISIISVIAVDTATTAIAAVLLVVCGSLTPCRGHLSRAHCRRAKICRAWVPSPTTTCSKMEPFEAQSDRIHIRDTTLSTPA